MAGPPLLLPVLDLEPPQREEAQLDAAGVRLRPDRPPHDLRGLVRRDPHRPDILPHFLWRDSVDLRRGNEGLKLPRGAGDEMPEREASPTEDRELPVHALHVDVPPHSLRTAGDLRGDPPQREVRELVAPDLLPVPEDPALELRPRPFRGLVQREVQREQSEGPEDTAPRVEAVRGLPVRGLPAHSLPLEHLPLREPLEEPMDERILLGHQGEQVLLAVQSRKDLEDLQEPLRRRLLPVLRGPPALSSRHVLRSLDDGRPRWDSNPGHRLRKPAVCPN